MAARKSCTKFTWAEAKSKTPGGGSSSGGSKAPPKKTPHNKILAEKIIAKSGDPQERTLSKARVKRAQREDEKATAAIAVAKEERDRERRSRTVKPHEQARERMTELALKLQKASLKDDDDDNDKLNAGDKEKWNEIKECKEMQLDEIMALEAIYADTDEFLVSDASRLEEMRQTRETLFDDEDDEAALRALVRHPPLSFSIQLTIDIDNSRQSVDDDSHMELVGSILLSVELPPLYPFAGSPPRFDFTDIMVTDKTAVCSPDKAPESLAFMDETKLREGMLKEATEILPDPCVYEVVTWLSENAFAFLQIRTHAILS
jgi:hypothetical protein